MPDIELLAPDQWTRLRDLRLSALQDSPSMFLATYDRERTFSQEQWRAEFDRGEWYYCTADGQPISLLGVTREPGRPADECYIEYLWVSPGFRRRGVALNMLKSILRSVRDSGVRTAYLWVLDGNDSAVRLYRQVGFVSTNHLQPIETRPGRTEERMALLLDGPDWRPIRPAC